MYSTITQPFVSTSPSALTFVPFSILPSCDAFASGLEYITEVFAIFTVCSFTSPNAALENVVFSVFSVDSVTIVSLSTVYPFETNSVFEAFSVSSGPAPQAQIIQPAAIICAIKKHFLLIFTSLSYVFTNYNIFHICIQPNQLFPRTFLVLFSQTYNS